MKYKTSLDPLAKCITITVSILFAIIIILQLSLFKDTGLYTPLFTSLLFLTIYFSTYLFRPIYYSLTNEKIIIHRPLSNVNIDRKEIKSVEQIENGKLASSIRTFGVGGLFGYWGRFYNKKLGGMTWYATRRNKAILITTINNRKIVLTPDNPVQFVAEFS